MRFVWNLTLPFLFSSPVFAALATDADSALAFYRHKNSLFPSGQISRQTLQTRLIRSERDVSFRCSWDTKEYSLQSDQILRSIQVARFVETTTSTRLLSLNRSDASVLKNIPAQSAFEIIFTDDYWARVKNSTQEGWIPLHLLKAKHDDTGVFVNITDAYLRVSPDSSARVLTTLPRLRRVMPLQIEKNFLKVHYADQTGYVDITQFVSPADFAHLAYHAEKNWVSVAYRNNDMVITRDGQRLPLQEIKGYVPNLIRGVVVRSSERNATPPLRARVEIRNPEAHVWGVSRIAGHGEVWWKKETLFLKEQSPKSSPATLSLQDLLKRELYSVAFENKNSLKGLVSSEGVYLTEDGSTWTSIPQFGKNNYPVSIHPDGVWFVGPFQSKNRGRSFEPFIRWDHIAQAIESAYHRNPKILRLTKIEALPQSRVQISVDIGSRVVLLRSPLRSIHWSVIENKMPSAVAPFPVTAVAAPSNSLKN
ncbi:MAG: hypothetical protein AAGB31_01010 [Bdellovibrio sp.]